MPNTPIRKDDGLDVARIFKLIFLSVMGLTVLSLVVNVCLLFSFPAPSEEVKRLIETCSTTWKLGSARFWV